MAQYKRILETKIGIKMENFQELLSPEQASHCNCVDFCFSLFLVFYNLVFRSWYWQSVKIIWAVRRTMMFI